MANYPENALQVDKDWGSTGLWVRDCGHWANTDYASYNLPEWLIHRFDYWSAWYEVAHAPWEGRHVDNDSFEAYGLSLAIDLKLFLGADYYVFFRGTEMQPVPFDPAALPPP